MDPEPSPGPRLRVDGREVASLELATTRAAARRGLLGRDGTRFGTPLESNVQVIGTQAEAERLKGAVAGFRLAGGDDSGDLARWMPALMPARQDGARQESTRRLGHDAEWEAF